MAFVPKARAKAWALHGVWGLPRLAQIPPLLIPFSTLLNTHPVAVAALLAASGKVPVQQVLQASSVASQWCLWGGLKGGGQETGKMIL